MKNLPKIIIVCGPTATGKSDYAVKIAKEIVKGFTPPFGGEIISADSRQVYKGLDVGSGKVPHDKKLPSKKSTNYLLPTTYYYKGIPHHLLDVISPKKVFTVVDYVRLADKAIVDITSRGKLPIICGGTGFYIDALVYENDFPAVPTNKALRKKLQKNTPEENYQILLSLDPDRASSIDNKNNVRLIRAIEIVEALGKVPNQSSGGNRNKKYDVEWHYLDFPDELLKKRIRDRLLKRMKTGMLKEVRDLHNPPAGGGVSWKRLESLGLEYRYLALYLQGKLTKAEMLTQLEFAIWHYAKRQRTWFKKYGK